MTHRQECLCSVTTREIFVMRFFHKKNASSPHSIFNIGFLCILVNFAFSSVILIVMLLALKTHVISINHTLSITFRLGAIMEYLGLIFLFLIALDALHAFFLWLRRRRWERTVTRDADGVLANAAPYTLEGACPHAPRRTGTSALQSDTAILFIHGFADTPETWQLLVPRIHELTRATCRVMRLPYISTPLRLQHRATLDHWLDAIRDEVARLRVCHKKVFVAGHSLGGGLALLATRESYGALGERALPDGLILLAPLIRTPRKFGAPLDIPFWFADHLCVFTRVWPNPFPVVSKSADGRVYVRNHDRFIAFEIFRAMFKMTRRLVAHGAADEDVRPPILAFASMRDKVIDAPFTLRWLDGARIITTEEAGHLLQFDVGWEQRAEEIAAFISRA